MGNDLGILPVGLVTLEHAGPISLDACGIDNAHGVISFIQVHGHRFAIAAGGFDANATLPGLVLLEPLGQPPVAVLLIGEGGQSLAVVLIQGYIQCVFGDVDTEGCK